MLKASFTPILGNTKATFEIPFGNIERVADGREFPALNWVDVSDEEYGLTILSDTKYGFDVKGNTIRVTLIRTSHDPDPDPDRGTHNFTYSLYPHKGDFKGEDIIVRKGYELNHRFIASYIKTSNDSFTLAETKSFVSIDSPNVILTCFKKAENNDGLVLRIYESKGRRVKTTIRLGFGVEKVEEVDLIERPVEDTNFLFKNNKLAFKIDPFEIKTFLLSGYSNTAVTD